jgi:hypothetical protein
MEERQETLEYVTGPVGVSLEEAEQILADDDLFLTDPGSRYGFDSDEEDARVWGEAQEKLQHLADAAWNGAIFENEGVAMLLSDAASRVRELCRRAKERARDE